MRLVVDCMISINNITIVNLYVYVCLSILIATHTFVYAICNNVCKGTFHVTVSTQTILALVGLGTGNFTFITVSLSFYSSPPIQILQLGYCDSMVVM